MTARLNVVFFLLIFIIFWMEPAVYGHGDLHERIVATTLEIKSHPDSAFLYLKRGELFYQHIEYKKSIRDFKACSKKGYQSPRLNFGFARSYEGLGKLKLAETTLNEVLATDAQDVRALRLLGRILLKMERYEEAGTSFEKVIQYAEKTFTENYMEASLAWEKMGTPTGREKAVKSIQSGIETLGELMVFYDRLVVLFRNNQDFQTALLYQNKLIDKSNRKERGFYQRAQINLQKGDSTAAKTDLLLASEAIDKLPSRLKNIKSIKELKSDINTLLQSL